MNDRDKELLEAHYRKLQKVEDQLEFNALLDLYVSLYKRKFRGEPIFPVSNAHLAAIKDFKRNAGGKAYELLQHYFEMKDDWFEKQAYSLDCLNRNFHRVAASLTSRGPRRSSNKEILFDFYCESCDRPVRTNRVDVLVRCEECERSNKAPRRLTKEQRREAVLRHGSSFGSIDDPDLEEKKHQLLSDLKK